MRKWFNGNEPFIFMQDGAPCHTAKLAKSYLETEEVPLLPWPGNSPDLNPIENVWRLVKHRIAQQTISTKQQLISAIIDAWFRDTSLQQSIISLIESMPRRINDVIAAKGGNTKY